MRIGTNKILKITEKQKGKNKNGQGAKTHFSLRQFQTTSCNYSN